MALTRKMLEAMGVDEKAIEQIIEAHSETVNALKAERDGYKGNAAKYESVQKELDELKAAAEKGGKDPYKVKYEALKEEFESYKNDVSAKETKSAKENAYRALLKSAGISEKRIDTVLKVSDMDGVELDKEGKIKNSDKLTEQIKADWSDFIVKETETGAQTPNPPANNGGKMTRAEIYAKDEKGRYKYEDAERKRLIAENPDAFGINKGGI